MWAAFFLSFPAFSGCQRPRLPGPHRPSLGLPPSATLSHRPLCRPRNISHLGGCHVIPDAKTFLPCEGMQSQVPGSGLWTPPGTRFSLLQVLWEKPITQRKKERSPHSPNPETAAAGSISGRCLLRRKHFLENQKRDGA